MPIYDQGYQHWEGRHSGRAWRWLVITRHGVQGQLRSWVTRILIIVSWIPALLLVIILALWGLIEQKSDAAPALTQLLQLFPQMADNPEDYRLTIWTLAFHYFFQVNIFFSMIMVLVVGPSLISQDLRLNALPLYFSRPLSRLDYFLGKLGVILVCLGLVTVVPVLLAYVFGVLFSLDLGVIPDTLPLLLSCLGYSLVLALSTGMLMLGLSSLSRNSRYVALFWLGMWLIGGTVEQALTGFYILPEFRDLQMIQQERFQAQLSSPTVEVESDEEPAPQEWQPADLEQMVELRRREIEIEDRFADKIRNNWRPMVSFTDNLRRIEAAFLDTNSAWDQVEKLSSVERSLQSVDSFPSRGESLNVAMNKGPQYPWYWSAGVLLGLMGVSAWILNVRVRSLDRLK